MNTTVDDNKNQTVIETEALSKTYAMGRTQVKAVNGVNLQVERNEFVALMGPSGCGKSTLLHLLGCLDTPTEGKYWLEGQDVSTLSSESRARVRNRRIGFIFQSFYLLARHTALENVMLPLLYRGKGIHMKEMAKRALSQVGLTTRGDHLAVELSGGECQRVAIARALVTNPSILLADEPTGNLDSCTGREIMDLLAQLHQAGLTIFMVTHDDKIARAATRVIHMRDGALKNGMGKDVTL